MGDLRLLKNTTQTDMRVESRNAYWSVMYSLHDGKWNGSIRYMGNHICTASGCMTFTKCESELMDRLNDLSHDLYEMSKDCLETVDDEP